MVVGLFFLSFLSTMLTLALGILALVRLNFIGAATPITGLSLVTFVTVTVLMGTVTSGVFGRPLVKPIKKLSAAMGKVSRGDFTVQVENTGNTELGQLTRDFNRMVRDLGGMETLRNDFVTNVSHEFKTPLASIEGLAELLQSEDLTEEERLEYTRMIADSAHRLSVMTANILKLSKLENQEIVSEQRLFRLDEQLRQAILLLEPQWSAKELELEVDLEETEIFSSEELLMQVWTNIIGNAVKFTPAGGQLAVSLTDNGADVAVRIADTGIGMTPEVMDRIFDKFYQGDKSHASQGNGLGLALTKRILDLFGGSITVESVPDEGSVFTVTLVK